MNRNLVFLSVLVASTFAAFPALGQTNEDQAGWRIEIREKPDRNQFRLSYRMGFNISTLFENIARRPAPILGQPIPPSVTGLTYQNGYVAYPNPPNTNGLTWYWGYGSTNQILGDNLLLTYSGSGALLKETDGDPQHGFEFSYARQLGERDWCKWGVEAAFDYMDLTSSASGIADPQALTADGFTFPTPLVPPFVPPAPPYAHGPDGPGVLIQEERTTYPVNVVSRFDASVYGLKLGPYFEFPLAKRLSGTLNGGLALLFADSDFRVQQSVTLAGLGTAASSLGRSDFGVLVGGYVGGRLSYAVSDSVNLFTGLEYQNAGRYSRSVGDKRANIEFGNSLFVTFGCSYSF